MCIRDRTEPVEGARVLVIEDKEYERTKIAETLMRDHNIVTVSYTHLRAHETVLDLVCRLLLEKKQ